MIESEISASGAVVFWNCGPTSRQLLNEKLDNLGHAWVPERTDASALQNAMSEYSDEHKTKKRDQTVMLRSNKRPSKNGFSVFEEEKEEDRTYPTYSFTAKVENGQVMVSGGYASRGILQQYFEKYKGLLTGAAVGQALVKILASLDGVALRPSGGIYWIPQKSIREWMEVAKAVEAAADPNEGGENKVYRLTTKMDDQAVRAVKDAIIHELEMAVETLKDDLGSETIGEQALERRKDVAAALYAKAEHYEDILGTALGKVKDQIGILQEFITIMTMRTVGCPN